MHHDVPVQMVFFLETPVTDEAEELGGNAALFLDVTVKVPLQRVRSSAIRTLMSPGGF